MMQASSFLNAWQSMMIPDTSRPPCMLLKQQACTGCTATYAPYGYLPSRLPALPLLPVAEVLKGDKADVQQEGDDQLHGELLPAVASHRMRHLMANHSCK